MSVQIRSSFKPTARTNTCGSNHKNNSLYRSTVRARTAAPATNKKNHSVTLANPEKHFLIVSVSVNVQSGFSDNKKCAVAAPPRALTVRTQLCARSVQRTTFYLRVRASREKSAWPSPVCSRKVPIARSVNYRVFLALTMASALNVITLLSWLTARAEINVPQITIYRTVATFVLCKRPLTYSKLWLTNYLASGLMQ